MIYIKKRLGIVNNHERDADVNSVTKNKFLTVYSYW